MKKFIDDIVKKVLEESLEEKANSLITQIHEKMGEYEDEDHSDRDEFDDRESEVIGVDSNIKKQRKEMGEGEVEEGNAFSEARCKAGCKGGNGTPIEGFDGKKVTNWSEDDKDNCGCKKPMKETVRMTESELIDLIERLVREQQEAEGMKVTKKALKDTKGENDEYLESVNKKMKDYLKDGSKETYESNPKHFPKGNGELAKMDKKAYTPSKAVEEYIDNFAYSPGMENLQYDEIKPNDEWMEKNIEGSSMTGNNPEWANAVETDLGKKINEKRKKNLYGKEKAKSYNRVTQPVDEAGEGKGEDSLDAMFGKLGESNEKKVNLVKEEMEKMKHLLGYNKKTQ